MTENEGPEGRQSLVLIHLGKSGAGPRLLRDIALELQKRPNIETLTVAASNSEVFEELHEKAGRLLAIRTYATPIELALGIPRLARFALKVRRTISSMESPVVFSPMFSVWEALSVRILLPRGVPFIASIHDTKPHKGEESVLTTYLKRLMNSRANAFLCYSADARSKLEASNECGKREICQTVHPAFTRWSRDNEVSRSFDHSPLIVGVFGRLSLYKGLDMFVDAMESAKTEALPIVGQVVGSGVDPKGDYVRAHSAVSWQIGWVPEEDVNTVVRGFDILVLPYLEASQSGVLAVGIAEGTPILATPVDGLVEQIHETQAGVLAERVSSEALVKALRMLVADRSLLDSLSRNGIRSAHGRFSIARTVDDILALSGRLRVSTTDWPK